MMRCTTDASDDLRFLIAAVDFFGQVLTLKGGFLNGKNPATTFCRIHLRRLMSPLRRNGRMVGLRRPTRAIGLQFHRHPANSSDRICRKMDLSLQ